MHFGNPIAPLDGSYVRRFMEHGFSTAAAALGMPIRARMRRINTYYYDAFVPVTTDPDELAAHGAAAEQNLGAAMATFGNEWNTVFLPEIKRYLADWDAFDLRGATMPELVAHFDASLARYERLTAIHFLVGGPPPVAAEPDVLTGNAGFPGVVRGRAKVLRSLDDAAKLRHGDILAAETTAPPWTPLFATAAAVVTDTGGILSHLSHCAVVAREYMIPAVVGTGMATALIRDGQMLEVNGSAGTVRIIAA